MSDLSGKYQQLLGFIREYYRTSDLIPLHAPVFAGEEKQYLVDCIDSTYVSSVGPYVTRFETMMKHLTGAEYAVAMVNGTSALHIALMSLGVHAEDEVITQSLTFVATCNAISYIGAHPIFVDVDPERMGLSVAALQRFLREHAELRPQGCFNKMTGRRIAAVVPMHTFGFPVDMPALLTVCEAWHIPVVEDAAESLGSRIDGQHTGTFGQIGIFSFNGNKVVTCGGGGCLVTQDPNLAAKAKHLSTTARQMQGFSFYHDMVGYNYRMPNVNAALGCAQLEQLPDFLINKRETASAYREFCNLHDIPFCDEPAGTTANFWLNCICLDSLAQRNAFLHAAEQSDIQCRPAWTPMHQLPMYRNALRDELTITQSIVERLVNLPSSVRTLPHD